MGLGDSEYSILEEKVARFLYILGTIIRFQNLQKLGSTRKLMGSAEHHAVNIAPTVRLLVLGYVSHKL